MTTAAAGHLVTAHVPPQLPAGWRKIDEQYLHPATIVQHERAKT
ncbi:MAG TPA: hypothetical protein PKZ07_18435 [Sedimentisphaerales bacterium]|nr:hypothetical protein [Sedimentisphaerales bacterium]